MIGALINAGAVLVGGGAGLLFKGKIPQKFSENIFKVIGLCVCVLGVMGAIEGDAILLIASLTLGFVLGELARIDGGINKFGGWLQKKLSKDEEDSKFAEGFVTASLLFCAGAMAIVGSIESGLSGDRTVILTKSLIDGISALILASTFGFGVLFSAAVVLIYQGGIELVAHYAQAFFPDGLVTQLSAVGGVMIIAIGLNMALNAKIKIANLLPGLLVAAGHYFLFLV